MNYYSPPEKRAVLLQVMYATKIYAMPEGGALVSRVPGSSSPIRILIKFPKIKINEKRSKVTFIKRQTLLPDILWNV